MTSYITYAPIDRQFGLLERDLPPGALFNGIDPLDGITFGFQLESRYPLAAGVPDVRFGTMAKKPADNPAILLRVVSKAEYDAAYAAEMAARAQASKPSVPQEVTRRQAKLVLLAAGLLTAADEAIAAIPGIEGEAARINWQDATVLRRDNPLIFDIGMALNLTSDQIDAMFIEAAQIP